MTNDLFVCSICQPVTETMQNEVVGFTAYSVEETSSAINRYGRQNDMEPISVAMIQEGEGSGATIKAMAVFTPGYREDECVGDET